MIWRRFAAVGVALLLLSGCAGRMSRDPTLRDPTSASPTAASTGRAVGFARLDDPRMKNDTLPAAVLAIDGSDEAESLVPTSSRLLAATSNARYFLARSNDGGVCVVLVPRTKNGSTPYSCGSSAGISHGPLQVDIPGISAILAADNDSGALDKPGFVRVAKNLAVKETGK